MINVLNQVYDTGMAWTALRLVADQPTERTHGVTEICICWAVIQRLRGHVIRSYRAVTDGMIDIWEKGAHVCCVNFLGKTLYALKMPKESVEIFERVTKVYKS